MLVSKYRLDTNVHIVGLIIAKRNLHMLEGGKVHCTGNSGKWEFVFTGAETRREDAHACMDRQDTLALSRRVARSVIWLCKSPHLRSQASGCKLQPSGKAFSGTGLFYLMSCPIRVVRLAISELDCSLTCTASEALITNNHISSALHVQVMAHLTWCKSATF